jgi:Ca2+-binding RTX toxin-like protein
VGTAKADVIKAGGSKDRINGRGGNDRLYGGSGGDRLLGGRGKDRLYGGSGRDRLLGGRGADQLNSVDGRRDRRINGGLGHDHCWVDPADRATVRGCEIVTIVRAGGPGGPLVCAAPPEDARLARALDDDPPLTFSHAFYGITTTITASADGLTGEDLPISIEAVCDVPKSLATEAAQLVGGSGVALITPATAVFDATGQRLTGDAATTAVSGADSVVIRARLLSPGGWRQDEDGEPVPTFSTSRVNITD